MRIAGQHALALRRAGLHGNRDARREEHGGRLAEPLPAAREHAEHATPFRAVALTPQLPRMLQGTAPALAMSQIGQFGIRAGQASDMVSASFEAEYAAAADRVLNGTGREAFDAMQDAEDRRPGAVPAGERRRLSAQSAFGQALQQIAQLIKADVGLEVAFADVGGWDTHVNQGARRASSPARLDDFARGIAALVTDLGDRMDDTVVLTMSEFGRAVSENGNRGTDHGHGNAMMVIGGGVRGGKVYGKWPGLAREQRYEGRDLAVTTDFRDVFAEIVVRPPRAWPTARPIFPGFDRPRSDLGFLGSRLEERRIADYTVAASDDHYRSSNPSRPHRSRRALERTSIGMQAAANRARRAAAAARQDPQVAGRRAVADRARRGRHLLREARRGGSVRRRRDHRHPAALSGQPGQRRPRACARSIGSRSRSSSITSTSRAAGRHGDDARRARRSTCWSRSTSGSIAAASIPAADARGVHPGDRVAAGPALRGLLSHAGHAYHAASDGEICSDRAPEPRR